MCCIRVACSVATRNRLWLFGKASTLHLRRRTRIWERATLSHLRTHYLAEAPTHSKKEKVDCHCLHRRGRSLGCCAGGPERCICWPTLAILLPFSPPHFDTTSRTSTCFHFPSRHLTRLTATDCSGHPHLRPSPKADTETKSLLISLSQGAGRHTTKAIRIVHAAATTRPEEISAVHHAIIR